MIFDTVGNMDSYERKSAEDLAEILCRYDVISFDVFGTLVLRPFSSPRVLFSIMEERLTIYKFSNIRVDSEDEIRACNAECYGHDNTTLQEIYQLIARKTNLDAEKTAELEYELELNYCFANPCFKKVVSLCKKYNKKLVVCTDMYLSSEQICGILKNSGYPDFDGIFVSSELKKSKKKGDIYSVLREKYRNQKIIHIGDNYVSDIENAESCEIDAYYYKNINDIGGKNRIDGMSYITGRVYSAIINNHLYCENRNTDEAYELGYIYGGIYILGFVQWINQFACEHDIDKIIFLSRDGDVYSRMYDKLPGHKDWEYFYWSRIAGVKITAMENFYEFCQRMIWHKARGVYNIKISYFLDFFDISFLAHLLPEYDLSEDDILSKTTAPKLENLFFDNKDDIVSSFQNDYDATLTAVKRCVGNAKRIAIVDVGWAGTGTFILKKLINTHIGSGHTVYSLLAGYRQPIENISALHTMNGLVRSYFFTDTSNRDLSDMHINTGTKMNNLLLEIFTQSCSPSFLGYTKDGLKFDWEESSNYDIIRRINKGTEDFIDYYLHTFRTDRFIMNISPYDAYLPFNELKNSSERLNNILSELIISRGKFYDPENTSKETWLSFFNK